MSEESVSMSQHYGAPGPYGQGGYQQPPQQPGYSYPPQGGQPQYGGPQYGQPPVQQWPPQAPQMPQPPKQLTTPVAAWIGLAVAILGIITAIYRLVPYGDFNSPAVPLGLIGGILSFIAFMQARGGHAKGGVATLALLLSIASIMAGVNAQNEMREAARSIVENVRDMQDCIATSETSDEIRKCMN